MTNASLPLSIASMNAVLPERAGRRLGGRSTLCQGIEELLRLIRELRERNVSLVSHQEPWLNGSDATTELLAAVAAWVATQESIRRSERIRAGLARRRAEGKPIGGAASKRGKDKRPRRTEGYTQAWARRKAAQQPDATNGG